METKKQINLLNVVKEVRIMMGFMGFYPTVREKITFTQKISLGFVGTIFVPYLISGSIYTYLNKTDLGSFSDSCSFVLMQTSLTNKLLTFLYYRKNIIATEDMLRNPLFTEVNDEEERLLERNMKLSKIIKTYFLILIVVNPIIFGFYPLLDHELFFHMWVPFDLETHFYKVYCYQVVLSILGITSFTSIDIFTVVFLDLCAGQFLLLQHRLERFGSTLSKDDFEDNKLRIQTLKRYIEHHNLIYDFCGEVEETLSIGIFFQIVFVSLIMCFTMFQVLVIPIKSIHFFCFISYGFYILWELATYCYFGQKIINSSESIKKACYACPWYNSNLEVQKCLLMIMKRSDDPIAIKAGGIFTLNMETLKNILSTAYSFFTLLWQTYQET